MSSKTEGLDPDAYAKLALKPGLWVDKRVHVTAMRLVNDNETMSTTRTLDEIWGFQFGSFLMTEALL